MYRYFSFWYSTLANGGEPHYVSLGDKEAYLFTKRAAAQNGPIVEDYYLKKNVEKIWDTSQ